MRLQRLTGLEREKILEEHREVPRADRALEAILADPTEVDAHHREPSSREIKEQYGDARRTTDHRGERRDHRSRT